MRSKKKVDDKHIIIVWNIHDLKLPHVYGTVAANCIDKLSDTYRKEAPLIMNCKKSAIIFA